LLAEQVHKALDKCNALLAIGVSPFGQHAKEQRKGHALVNYTEHEDVDVRLPELPVGAVDGQFDLVAFGQQGEDEPGHQVAVQGETGHETLDTPERGIRSRGVVEGIGQLVEGHGAYLAKRANEKRDQLYPCQVELSFEMCVENCCQFIIFNASIGFLH